MKQLVIVVGLFVAWSFPADLAPEHRPGEVSWQAVQGHPQGHLLQEGWLNVWALLDGTVRHPADLRLVFIR